MRTSVLARSVIAAATLAVGSATLVATSANAATPSGITQESVLTAATGLRAALASSSNPDQTTVKALRKIVSRGCSVNSDDGELLYQALGIPTTAGASADGLVGYGEIYNAVDGTARECIVGVVASSAPGYTLRGTATLTYYTDPGNQASTITAPLSGDVSTTAPVSVSPDSFSNEPTFSATGTASKVTQVPAKTVKDKKTTSEKKAAKKTYVKKLKALKKSYKKALDKAGSSKSKKAAAKKTYAVKKKAAKAKYTYAIANYKIIKKATTTEDKRPFSVSLIQY